MAWYWYVLIIFLSAAWGVLTFCLIVVLLDKYRFHKHKNENHFCHNCGKSWTFADELDFLYCPDCGCKLKDAFDTGDYGVERKNFSYDLAFCERCHSRVPYSLKGYKFKLNFEGLKITYDGIVVICDKCGSNELFVEDVEKLNQEQFEKAYHEEKNKTL